ncbi:TnsD family Tn7-like transposition protein [Alteromonas australica]|uniref:TnsD family Tn7-like transposition protein n=1 Tax=Alteromonas australica TaxID=589873 RepID=UPI0035C7B7B7
MIGHKMPILLALRQTETVFSFLVRWRKWQGFLSESYLCQRLYAKRSIRLHPYLPPQLAQIGEAIDVLPEHLLLNHTLFPLFALFNQPKRNVLKSRMLHAGNSVISSVGIPHAQIPVKFGHKWCPLCMQEDMQKLGFCILVIEHQIPGVIACAKHSCLLQFLVCGQNAPDRGLKMKLVNPQVVFSGERAANFSAFCCDVLALAKEHADINVQEAYTEQLISNGYITNSGRFRMKRLEQDFYSEVLGSPHFLELDVVSFLKKKSFLGPMLRRKTGYPAHPLKHLIFSFWLFNGDSTKLILRSHKGCRKALQAKSVECVNNEILDLLRNGMSMNHIEVNVGKSRCYIRRLAELNGIKHQSNAMKYPESTRRAVQIKALMGKHRQEIANELKVGIGYVEQVISNTHGLAAYRKSLRMNVALKRAQNEITGVVKRNPTWNRTQVRAAAQSAYSLLYAKNRELLDSCLPKPIRPSPPKKKVKTVKRNQK